MKVLLTGGSGFFGGVLKKHLTGAGHHYVNLDRLNDPGDESRNRMALVDLRDRQSIQKVFREMGPFDAVCHAAADLAHEARDAKTLWASNVEGTRHIADSCKEYQVGKLIFTSTNCLWGAPLNRPVVEEDVPKPVEIYGRSKLAAERLLRAYEPDLDVIIFRSSTIIGPGRVGLLGILFDFILEGRPIPVVGRGDKPYQFISADDYARAILLSLDYGGSNTFHVGSRDPTSLRESYAYVIKKVESPSRIYRLPKLPAVTLMRLMHALGLSPLGPYQYNMIAEEFVFDTTRIEKTLGWRPTQNNGEILWSAFEYYLKHRIVLGASATNLSAHQRSSHPGIIRLLKWMS